jgi:hypothetical protein
VAWRRPATVVEQGNHGGWLTGDENGMRGGRTSGKALSYIRALPKGQSGQSGGALTHGHGRCRVRCQWRTRAWQTEGAMSGWAWREPWRKSFWNRSYCRGLVCLRSQGVNATTMANWRGDSGRIIRRSMRGVGRLDTKKVCAHGSWGGWGQRPVVKHSGTLAVAAWTRNLGDKCMWVSVATCSEGRREEWSA